jgi:DNA-binding Lrp family transcriptional regulator
VAFVQVTLGNHAGEAPLEFERHVASMPEILSCHNVTGDCDYMLQIVARDLMPMACSFESGCASCQG